jgi:hypothetical protein
MTNKKQFISGKTMTFKSTIMYKELFVPILCLLVCDCKCEISRTMVVEMARLLCTGQDICSANMSQTDTFQDTSSCCSGTLLVLFHDM